MKFLFVLFAIVAIVAANPEQERERRGILSAGPALASPWIAPRIAAAPVAIGGAGLLGAHGVVAGPALGAGWAGLARGW